MPLIGAESILGVLDMYRLIWISGRFGGHKTALAFQISKRYLEKGYKLVTNSRSIWADDINDIQLDENNHLKSVVLLDEGGLYFKMGRQIEQIAAYAAKMDCIYIIPSFFPPAKLAQIINIQPVVSLKSTGLPVIIYKWRVDIGAHHEKGFFIWWQPSEIYGIYSRQDPGDDPDEIINFLVERSNDYRKRYGREESNKVSSLEAITEGDKFIEAAEVFETATDDFEAVFKRGNKRRR